MKTERIIATCEAKLERDTMENNFEGMVRDLTLLVSMQRERIHELEVQLTTERNKGRKKVKK